LWAPSKTTRGIRIPPQAFHTPVKRNSNVSPDPELPAKRRRKLEDTVERGSSSEQTEPHVLAKRSKGKQKRGHAGTRSPVIPGASTGRRGRGRPRKDLSADFSAHVFVEIANPPKLRLGRTHKTDKYVVQEPTTEGPFSFTHCMSYESFMLQVAELAELEKENVALTQMTWHFQGKTKALPIGNASGFAAMVMQIRGLKVGASAIIMLGLPVPPAKPSRGGRNAPTAASGEDVDVTGSGASGALWDEKVCDSCILIA